MGCNQSTSRPEIEKDKFQSELGDVTIRCAYFSHRGHYPHVENKPNQDSFVITKNFTAIESDLFVGVFDGHGGTGHNCSQYVRDTLPDLLAQNIQRARDGGTNGKDLTEQQLEEIIKKAHEECNARMHTQEAFDDSASGTTSISAYLQGKLNKITVNNVGDSRAILGSLPIMQEEVKETATLPLVASALSKDHTPWRKDERERIEKCGGRILSMGQLEEEQSMRQLEEEHNKDTQKKKEEDPVASGGRGSRITFAFDATKKNKTPLKLAPWELLDHDLILGEEIDESGDPPRVWCEKDGGQFVLGAGFTRTMGDRTAEERVGLIAEPEVLVHELTPQDKVVFLASDGVFEFLTNQQVMDICAECPDPLEACEKIASKSRSLWMSKDAYVDDITMICIYVDSVVGSSLPSES